MFNSGRLVSRLYSWYDKTFLLLFEILLGAIVGNTVAGQTGTAGGWSYLLNSPSYLTMDQFGYLYISDSGNNRVQKWLPGAPYGTTVVSGSLSTPRGVRLDPNGNLIWADHWNHRVLSFAVTCRKYALEFKLC